MPCGVGRGLTQNPRKTQNPFGVYLSHADGADFLRSMRSKFCVSLWVWNDSWQKNIRTYVSHAKAQSFAKRLRGSALSACNIFDIRTKVHNASRPLRLCVRFFHTESTENTEPCGVELSHADGADFCRSMRSKFCVSLCENKICSCVLMSKNAVSVRQKRGAQGAPPCILS